LDRQSPSALLRKWNEELGAFTQFYDGDSLDAANLIMPLVFFVSPNDPRMLSTLDAIDRPPHEGGSVADNLVFRYNTTTGMDGLTGDEGTFNMCTFWLVEALTRAAVWMKRATSLRRCWVTRIIWAYSPRRQVHAVKRWATSPRRSRTSR
jgi:GH15 family glucan-1,4-alpha-glucosidase